jgi:hypothetical protein
LLASPEQTDFQGIEKLHQMGDLGDKKPSELQSSMLELCPRGHEVSKFFVCVFAAGPATGYQSSAWKRQKG